MVLLRLTWRIARSFGDSWASCLSPCRVYEKVPEESTLIFVHSATLFLVEKRLHAKNELDPSSHFNRTPTCEWAALTGKHDTLVRRAPGWQEAPDSQQAKKLVVTKMFILHNKRFDMPSWFGFPEYIFCSERDIHLFIFFTYLVLRIIRHSMTLLANFVTPKSVKEFQAWTTHHRLFYYSVVTNIDCIYISEFICMLCWLQYI